MSNLAVREGNGTGITFGREQIELLKRTICKGATDDELALIDISGEKAELRVLCGHGTSWHTQSSHCHPTWSWDGRRILFASDRGGRVNLYMVEPGV